MTTNSHQPPFYRRPPVIERVVGVYAEMSDEVFEGRFDEWRAIVEKEYPVYEPLTEWLIQVKDTDHREEGAIPLFDTMQPELRITPRFSRKSSKENFDWSIRCPRGQLTMNMHSRPTQGAERRYDTLRAEFSRWLPRWLAHFSVESMTRVTAHYVNLVNRHTVPAFVTKEGRLLLDQVVAVFSQIPGEHECLIPPYDCKATLLLQGQDGATLRLNVNDWSSKELGAAVRVDFIVDAPAQNLEASGEKILQLLDWCHERIIERFEVVFTEKAKKTFEPVTE